MKNKILFIGLIFVSFFGSAQLTEEIDLEEFAERRFQLQDEDINYEDLYESLLLFYTNPVNLNRTDREELASLYILSPSQLNSYFNYREKRGKLLSLYELQAVPEFDMGTIRDLLPFVTLIETADGRPLLQRVFNEPNNYFLLRYTSTLESEEGYQREDGSGYQGRPGTIYGRFKVSHSKDFSLGFTFEKDAGEQLLFDPKNQQYGMDFYSAHLLIQNKGKLKSLAIGDYQLQQGQGLVLGSGFAAGKGSETVNTVKRNTVGLRPYSSVLESGFFRGAAATVSFGKLEATAFGSTLLQDANLVNDTTYSDFEEFVNSIQATGMHRTSSELDFKNSIRENSAGFALDYKVNPRFKVGSTGIYSGFSKPLQKKPNNYNQFEFRGDQNFTTSIYANYNWQNFIFFGEAARSSSGGIGAIGGLMTSLTPTLDFSWTYRQYDKDFHSFYGNGFGESSRNINEQGMYWGISYKPNRRFRWVAYFDKFTFPWLRYRVNAPSEGFEYLSRFTFSPSRHVHLYAQYRQENKEQSYTPQNSNLSQLIPTSKKNYIFNVDYAVGRTFSFKTRVQGSSYRVQGSSYNEQQKTTNGIAVIQDVNLTFWKMKLSTRFAIFETDDYQNRQYVYERNVLYTFSIPAYSGAGIRSYAMVQYTASRSLTFWLRYARFHYENQDNVGSGLSQINDNTKSEVRLMLRYKFRK